MGCSVIAELGFNPIMFVVRGLSLVLVRTRAIWRLEQVSSRGQGFFSCTMFLVLVLIFTFFSLFTNSIHLGFRSGLKIFTMRMHRLFVAVRLSARQQIYSCTSNRVDDF